MIAHKIDPNTKLYVCDVILGDDPPIDLETLSPTYILTPIPESCISPKWDGEQWISDTYPNIDINDFFVERTTLEERLSAVESAMLDIITRW